eukprot:scaffold365880_cov27-Prasinocladus_malaysianus.AAC.1
MLRGSRNSDYLMVTELFAATFESLTASLLTRVPLLLQERVLDLLDIDYLRLAAKDTDPAYKTLVWNLSQNVDRTTGSVRPGICPCLTPTMVPFVTNRGGP